LSEKSNREIVLELLSDGVVRTDAEIAEETGVPYNKASGARATLWEQGLVERIEKDEANPRLRWRICPPERREQARVGFRDNSERRTLGRLRQRSTGERANIVVELLSNDEVNDAVLAQIERGREWRRARARANEVRAERAAARRVRRSELRRAAVEGDPKLHFMTQLSYLRDTIDGLFAIRRCIVDEQARIAAGDPQHIQASDWLSLGRNVREVLELGQVLFADVADLVGEPMSSCPLCGERLPSAAVHIGEGYVDAEVVEDEEPVNT
jgi:hypothetical protein